MPATPRVLYMVTFGLSGCYTPDSAYPVEVNSRRDFAALIRAECESAGFPKSAVRQARIRRMWGFIHRNGSSVAHFAIRHGAHEIGFNGLTVDEYAAEAERD